MASCRRVNSDSDERARRLNIEAAKMIRYGGLTEEEALKLVTLNPAMQLGVDNRVGSIDVGKDADLAIWTAHPLSVYARVEQTFVDGELAVRSPGRHRAPGADGCRAKDTGGRRPE